MTKLDNSANGAPTAKFSYNLTLSQVVRDLIEVDQRETGATEAQSRDRQNFRASLASKDERSAFAVAWRIKRNDYAPLAYVLPKHDDKARLLRYVADALDAIEGRGKFGPKGQVRLNVVRSYFAAVDHLHEVHFGDGEGLIERGDQDPTIPTLAQVREQFVRLFGEQLLPADWSIRKTLRGLKIQLREGKGGAPRKSAPKKRH